MDWFLFDNGLRHERVKTFFCAFTLLMQYVVLTVSDVKFLERTLFRRDTKTNI